MGIPSCWSASVTILEFSSCLLRITQADGMWNITAAWLDSGMDDGLSVSSNSHKGTFKGDRNHPPHCRPHLRPLAPLGLQIVPTEVAKTTPPTRLALSSVVSTLAKISSSCSCEKFNRGCWWNGSSGYSGGRNHSRASPLRGFSTTTLDSPRSIWHISLPDDACAQFPH